MELVFFKKVCPFVFMWVDGVRHKNLMVVNGMGGKFAFFLGGGEQGLGL